MVALCPGMFGAPVVLLLDEMLGAPSSKICPCRERVP